MAKTLAELSKQANELYADFVNSWNQNKHDIDELEDLIPYTDDYDLEYLNETTGKSGHCDEPILQNYWDAQDEDGNYVHPLGKVDWE